jgi:molybdopterin molybdotransferase
MEALQRIANEACSAGARGEVISVDVAAAMATALANPLTQSECVTLSVGRGRILARPLKARIDLPPFSNSAMDGYAVRTADLVGEGPWTLSVMDRIAAGDGRELAGLARSAVRIFTGAPVPAAYDAVIMQENVARQGNVIGIERRPRLGENIRRAGEDVRSGDSLLEGRVALTPQRLALLAAQGIDRVDVLRRVRVGLISTGSELAELGSERRDGQIYNSNRVMLNAILAGFAWAEIIDLGIVADDETAIANVLREAADSCDVIITTGGVSAGEEDHVVRALAATGAEPAVLKVAMRPGKPVKVGQIGEALFAGLPGNPNAALITFQQIALPAIRKVAGLAETRNDSMPAVAGFDYAKKLGRTEFVPAKVVGRDEHGRPVVTMLGRGSSSSLTAMAAAEGIAILPADCARIEPSVSLRFEPLGCM